MEHQNQYFKDIKLMSNTHNGFYNPYKINKNVKTPKSVYSNAKNIKQEWLNKAIERRKTSDLIKHKKPDPSLRNVFII